MVSNPEHMRQRMLVMEYEVFQQKGEWGLFSSFHPELKVNVYSKILFMQTHKLEPKFFCFIAFIAGGIASNTAMHWCKKWVF